MSHLHTPTVFTGYIAIARGDRPAADMALHPREEAVLGPRSVDKRRKDFCRGRAVAKCLLAHVLNVNSKDLWVLPNSLGVPEAFHSETGSLPLSMSISHTQHLAAAAMLPLPARVGVDVEQEIHSPDGILRDFFTDQEQALCMRCMHNASYRMSATRIWSLKEAGLKVLGVGLRASAHTVQVQHINEHADAHGWYDAQLHIAADWKEELSPTQSVRSSDRCRMLAWVQTRENAALAVAMALIDPAMINKFGHALSFARPGVVFEAPTMRPWQESTSVTD